MDAVDILEAQIKDYRREFGREPEVMVIPRIAFEWIRMYLVSLRTKENALFPFTCKHDIKAIETAEYLDWNGTRLQPKTKT